MITEIKDALIVTDDDSNPSETEEIEETSPIVEAAPTSSEEEPEELNEFDQLIRMMLDLDPAKYAFPWEPIELQKMREVLTAGNGKFPKKVRPYIHLIRKFLFASAQLIAMAALAHQTAVQKRNKEESLIKPPSFSDLGKVEASRVRGE
ncbi:hypothetical protein LCGC14_0487690 [marine sediment metagenome]|uniref:Uncharacterized protein n=1 Tax=marine sediment metagenome TaxID=412755 RepID=A0A0F9SCV7_9ZZZZ